MITSPDEKIIVSSLGWTDKDSLWLLETRTGSIATVRLSDAKYLSLHGGRNGHFAVQHHYDDGHAVAITAHSFPDPQKVRARITITASNGASRFDGDVGIWQYLPKAYVAYFKRPGVSDCHLFLVDSIRPEVTVADFPWYDNSYDKDWQSIIGVVEVPNRDLLIVSVQRDSHPVLMDAGTKRMVGKLSLAGAAGNPTLRFRQRANELWADDYDNLLRIDPDTWRVRNRKRLQGGVLGCSGQFIGAFAFNADETLCVVARPFSGDVVALDTTRFRVTHTCNLGHQPLRVALLSDGTVWARDWKTGKLLKGSLKKRWFA